MTKSSDGDERCEYFKEEDGDWSLVLNQMHLHCWKINQHSSSVSKRNLFSRDQTDVERPGC